jgi:transposase
MYRDRVQWTKVRRRILVQGIPIRQVARETGISRKTVRKMLIYPLPKPHGVQPGQNKEIHIPPPSLRVRRPVKVYSARQKYAKTKEVAFGWMLSVLQKQIGIAALRRDVGELPGLDQLTRRLYDGRISDRNRSMVILANRYGISRHLISRFLGLQRKTIRKYLRVFAESGVEGLFAPQINSNRKFDKVTVKNAIFGVLHEPPSNYGINRTTWTMAHLSRVLREKGQPACLQVIRKITKTAGYRWRKARIVLTSADPAFSEKLGRVRSILSNLGPDEAFFSIDEFGPFAVKNIPGRALVAPGEQHVVPQWQKSRGCLIITAALELSGNQVHHFFSTKKNTAEMIRMMNLLIERYRDRRKIYLSWDAASWHISKDLHKCIDEHNATGQRPVVETAPLPSGAQFLNVIESVFSGMARAIIHNSDYKNADEAKSAIDRYFAERNEHFSRQPRKAGNKIWRDERVAPVFSEANNCKDPRYR